MRAMDINQDTILIDTPRLTFEKEIPMAGMRPDITVIEVTAKEIQFLPSSTGAEISHTKPSRMAMIIANKNFTVLIFMVLLDFCYHKQLVDFRNAGGGHPVGKTFHPNQSVPL